VAILQIIRAARKVCSIKSLTTREVIVGTNASLAATTSADHLLFAVDIAGTLVFALEGAMAAVNGNLDLIGVMVLAFCTALGGGIVRDVLLGALPPASLRDWRYPTIVLTVAVMVFFLHQPCGKFRGRRYKYWTRRDWRSSR
jgi:uncharacterized membrane protein YeiH